MHPESIHKASQPSQRGLKHPPSSPQNRQISNVRKCGKSEALRRLSRSTPRPQDEYDFCLVTHLWRKTISTLTSSLSLCRKSLRKLETLSSVMWPHTTMCLTGKAADILVTFPAGTHGDESITWCNRHEKQSAFRWSVRKDEWPRNELERASEHWWIMRGSESI